MVYIDSNGRIVEKQPWSIQRVIDFFLGIISVLILFFRTMIDPSLSSRRGGSSDYRPNRKPDPGAGGPRRRMGGFGGAGDGPSCPPMSGGGG